MAHIVIIAASVRIGRKSDRVALYFKQFIEERNLATAEILDLNTYQFPIFNERLKFHPNPTPQMLEVADKITKADGVIICTPEYNGGYPASLKNFTDLLYAEWHRKPIAISTASDGAFGGTQVITSLQFSLWKMKSWTVPAMFPVPSVDKTFDEDGNPAEKEKTDKRATAFIDELMWCITAKSKMDN